MNMRNYKTLLALCGSALLMIFVSGAAFGGSAGGSISVSATVSTNCKVSSPTLTFTAIDPTAAVNSTGSAVLAVNCTKGTTILDIKLGPGLHQIANGSRQVNNAGNATN